MNTKTLLGGLIAGIIGFLLGYLIYGVLLMDYFKSNMIHPDDGLVRAEPVLWEIGIANLAWGLLTAYIFSIAGIKSVAKGLTTGFIISLLSSLGYDMLSHGTMNMSGYRMIAIDVACSAVIGAIIGAVLGWWFGMGKKPAVA